MIATGGRIATIAIFALALLSVPTYAVTIDDGFVIGLLNSPDDVFYDADLSPDPAAFLVAELDATGDIGGYSLYNGRFSLTEAQLALDDSATKGKPWAVFDDNYQTVTATLTITADYLLPQTGGVAPILPVLVAEVTGQFECYKKDPRPGETNVIIHAIQEVTVVGGEFWSGSIGDPDKVTDVIVPDVMQVTYVFDNCWGDAIPITDFGSTIGWSPPNAEVHFTPEPATLFLLVIGSLGISRKRRA